MPPNQGDMTCTVPLAAAAGTCLQGRHEVEQPGGCLWGQQQVRPGSSRLDLAAVWQALAARLRGHRREGDEKEACSTQWGVCMHQQHCWLLVSRHTASICCSVAVQAVASKQLQGLLWPASWMLCRPHHGCCECCSS